MATIDAYLNRVTCGDALDLLKALPDASVDMILTDPPYGVHEAEWDKPFDIPAFWNEAKRVIKPRHAIVITSVQPFTTDLIVTNRDWFKYSWVWVKSMAGDFFNAKNKPMRIHEDILVFSDGTTANKSNNQMPYYPQGTRPLRRIHSRPYSHKFRRDSEQIISTRESWKPSHLSETTDYPNTVLSFPNSNHETIHPNQKPLELFKYLIETYTLRDEIVLDMYAGSGTTGRAALETERQYILRDSSAEYCALMEKRLALPYTPNMFAALEANG